MESDDFENTLFIELETGEVLIELLPEIAPLHVERIKELARAGEYDNVAFHRVFEGALVQTGDIEFGDLENNFDRTRVGTGGSDLPDLPLEFEDIPFERGTVGMARTADPDSANSQFFITLRPIEFSGPYTVFGRVTEGIEAIDEVKAGDPQFNGAVLDPDAMVNVEVYADLFGLGLTAEEAQEVALLYETALDRDGEIDAEGLNFWIDVREGGLSIEEVAGFFLDNPEFEAAFGDVDALGDRELVELLYRNVLDREGDEDGIAFWTAAVGDPSFDRADLLYRFAVSLENAEDLAFIDTLAETEPGAWAFA